MVTACVESVNNWFDSAYIRETWYACLVFVVSKTAGDVKSRSNARLRIRKARKQKARVVAQSSSTVQLGGVQVCRCDAEIRGRVRIESGKCICYHIIRNGVLKLEIWLLCCDGRDGGSSRTSYIEARAYGAPSSGLANPGDVAPPSVLDSNRTIRS